MCESEVDYHELLQGTVAYCITCQPYDGGDYVWIFGDKWEMEDLLHYLGIPQEKWAEAVEGLECPNCGNTIEIDDIVGIKDEFELQVEATYDEWYKIWKDPFDEFQVHLSRWPYLGLEHDIGRKILQAVNEFPRKTIEDEIWYRARAPRDGRAMKESDLLPPDPAEVNIPEGRYNHFGQAAFYLAESDHGAVREVLQNDEGVAWVMKFRISGVQNVLKLTSDKGIMPDPSVGILAFGLIYCGVVGQEVNRTMGWKPEYFIPRFIADCARKSGLHGIQFDSSKSYCRNLVLFEWGGGNVTPIGNPGILAVGKEEESPF